MRQRSFSLSSFCRLACADGISNAIRFAFTANSLLLAAQCAASGVGGFNYQFPNLGAAPPTITAMVVDAAGNTYVTGNTCSATIPVTPGAFQTQFGGGCTVLPLIGVILPGGDAFVMKLDLTGMVLWATYLGGSGFDAGNAIAVDAAGNVYVAGETSSKNFPVTPGAAFGNLTTTNDGFEVKLTTITAGVAERLESLMVPNDARSDPGAVLLSAYSPIVMTSPSRGVVAPTSKSNNDSGPEFKPVEKES